METVKLNIPDRLYIGQLFGETGNYSEYNLKKSITEKVSLKKEDIEKYAIKQDDENGKITWDMEKDAKEPLEAGFTDDEIKYLRGRCEAVNGEKHPDGFWEMVEKIY